MRTGPLEKGARRSEVDALDLAVRSINNVEHSEDTRVIGNAPVIRRGKNGTGFLYCERASILQENIIYALAGRLPLPAIDRPLDCGIKHAVWVGQQILVTVFCGRFPISVARTTGGIIEISAEESGCDVARLLSVSPGVQTVKLGLCRLLRVVPPAGMYRKEVQQSCLGQIDLGKQNVSRFPPILGLVGCNIPRRTIPNGMFA